MIEGEPSRIECDGCGARCATSLSDSRWLAVESASGNCDHFFCPNAGCVALANQRRYELFVASGLNPDDLVES